MRVTETYTPKPMTASGEITPRGGKLGGFFCTSSTSGTLVIADLDGGSILASTSVTAGTWYPLPFSTPNGAVATLTSAAGTFAV